MKHRVLLGAILAACPVAASAQPAATGEFQVNTYTTNFQLNPAVAANGNGAFVFVWRSDHDGDLAGVFGRRVSASGVPLGGEFLVNTHTTRTQQDAAVASDADGNFVVVWRSRDQDGSLYGIFGQRFDAAGNRRGGEFQVNTYTSDSQLSPAVASDADGNFVVVWAGLRNGDYEIFGQRFAASGAPAGGEFQVNASTPDLQLNPAVAADADGDFVVVWTGPDGGGAGILGRRFNALGAPQGGDFVVNAATADTQSQPAVAQDPGGDFVVAWQGPDASSTGIFARRFDAAGSPQSGDIPVNTFTADEQGNPTVAVEATGSFVVTWASRGLDGSSYGVAGQRFDAAGTALGEEFQINEYTTAYQTFPVVAASASGNFVVAWHSFVGGSYEIRGRIFGDVIFRDGFE
jgi:hypothetical protein